MWKDIWWAGRETRVLGENRRKDAKTKHERVLLEMAQKFTRFNETLWNNCVCFVYYVSAARLFPALQSLSVTRVVFPPQQFTMTLIPSSRGRRCA